MNQNIWHIIEEKRAGGANHLVKHLLQAIAILPQFPLATLGKAGRLSVINAWEEFLQDWENFLEKLTA